MKVAIMVTSTPMRITSTKPRGASPQGTGTLIPHRLKINVGMARIMVTEVRNFMIWDRRLEMMEEKESIMDIRMFV